MIFHSVSQMAISVKMDPLTRVKDNNLSSVVFSGEFQFKEGKGMKPGKESLVSLVSPGRILVARRHIAGSPSVSIHVFAKRDQAGGIPSIASVAFHADP